MIVTLTEEAVNGLRDALENAVDLLANVRESTPADIIDDCIRNGRAALTAAAPKLSAPHTNSERSPVDGTEGSQS